VRGDNPQMTGQGEVIARRFWDAINTSSSAEEILGQIGDLLHADVEYVNPADALERGIRRGHEGIGRAFENYLAGVGPDARFEIEALVERGDRVFVRGHIHARGASSGAEVEGPGIGTITTFRDGLVYRIEWFWDKDEALAEFERS
jgi:ketosteroid isomerase-like protein